MRLVKHSYIFYTLQQQFGTLLAGYPWLPR